MTEKTAGPAVLVLTDRPGDYQAEFDRLGLALRCAPSVGRLLELLLDHPISGFVLEVERVMQAHYAERDHLFQVAGAFPILRVQRKPKGRLVFLDELPIFCAKVLSFAPRSTRSHKRVPVRLNALMASGEDRSFESPVKTNLLDISLSGGFVYSLEDFAQDEFVDLRILELSDPTPIHAHIRWRKKWGITHSLPGLGLLFTDIRPGQVEEILNRYISSQKQQELL